MMGTKNKKTLIKPVRFRKRKRDPKSNTPGQGRKLSVEKYNDLYAAYARTSDISKSAREAGIAVETARKYINDGSADYPAIKERIDLVNQRAFEDQDDMLIVQRRMFQEAAFDTGKDLIEALRSAKVQLTGKDLVGKDGKKVLDQDGKPIRVVSEATLGNAVAVLQKLQDTFDKASPQNAYPGGEINNSNTQIAIHIEAARAAEEGESVLKKLNVTHGGNKEELVRTLVAEEARKRGSQDDVIDIKPNDEFDSD